MTAALIDDVAGSVLDDELGVATRDVRMGEDEVVLRQAADGERGVGDGDGAATGAVDEDERDGGRMRGGHLAEIIDSVQRSAYSVQQKPEKKPRKIENERTTSALVRGDEAPAEQERGKGDEKRDGEPEGCRCVVEEGREEGLQVS